MGVNSQRINQIKKRIMNILIFLIKEKNPEKN